MNQSPDMNILKASEDYIISLIWVEFTTLYYIENERGGKASKKVYTYPLDTKHSLKQNLTKS